MCTTAPAAEAAACANLQGKFWAFHDGLLGAAGALVQCFVATKDVEASGQYDVTWTSTPAQGAQLWLVAVQ